MAWKRAAEIALVWCVAACPIALSGEDRIATDRFRARSLTYPYDEGAIWAMPGEKIPLAVTAPATRLHSLDAPNGALLATGPNTWTWEAPVKPGLYSLKVKNPAGDTVVEFFGVRHGAEHLGPEACSSVIASARTRTPR